MSFDTLTFNLSNRHLRYDQIDGRKYLVAPMVMITEGVHAGSRGPLYYSKKELAKSASVWNTKPIVVYHPEKNGESVTACSPEILNSRAVGIILNTRFEDGKLKAEAWLDPDKVKKVDDRILLAVLNNRIMEVSTGLYREEDDSIGTWNSVEYVGVAKGIKPDHLAILPDKIGACSIEDGAGLLQLNQLMEEYEGEPVTFEYVTNDESGETTIKVTKYNVPNTTPQENKMEKEKLVNDLIANSATKWTEEHREFLMEVDENNLQNFEPVVNETPEPKQEEVTPEAPQVQQPVQVVNKEVAVEEKPATLEEYIAKAPVELQQVLVNSVNTYNEQKETIVATLVANDRCTFTEDFLRNQDLEMLKGLQTLAVNENKEESTEPRLVNYAGQATVNPSPVVNSNVPGTKVDDEAPLVMPSMSFDRK